VNEHDDPSPSEVWAEVRTYGWRAWLVVAVCVAVAVKLLARVDPVVPILAGAGLVLAVPAVRVVFRVLLWALVLATGIWLIATGLAVKGATP
jgi:hypothetical protein